MVNLRSPAPSQSLLDSWMVGVGTSHAIAGGGHESATPPVHFPYSVPSGSLDGAPEAGDGGGGVPCTSRAFRTASSRSIGSGLWGYSGRRSRPHEAKDWRRGC